MEDEEISTIAKLKKAILRYQFIILGVVSAVTGFFLIVFAGRFADPEIARGFGIAFFASGSVGLLIEFCTRRHFEDLMSDHVRIAIEGSSWGPRLDAIKSLLSFGEDLRVLGIREVKRDRSAFDFSHFIQQAKPGSEIRLLGVCMMGFTNAPMQTLLKKKLGEGCTIKFLIIDAASEFVKQRALEEGREYEDIRVDIESSDTLHKNFIEHRVPQELRQNIELGHYDSAPSYFIVSISTSMVVGFYLREDRGEEFPHMELEIKEGGISATFQKHFESLWATRKEAVAKPSAKNVHKPGGNNAEQLGRRGP